jgi:hypothetical protein
MGGVFCFYTSKFIGSMAHLTKSIVTDDPIKTRLDMKTTEASIKEILKDGTPDWIRFPNDFKELAREDYAEQKERSDAAASQFKDPDTDILTDEKARLVNFKTTNEFLTVLRNNGVSCKVAYNNTPQTIALWAIGDPLLGMQNITWMQTPVMPEWDVMRTDEHGLEAGLAARGWRSVLVELVRKKVMSEDRIHQVFGQPVNRAFTVRYKKSLFNIRNGRV